jgi:exopolysaccharide biosynthesis protein
VLLTRYDALGGAVSRIPIGLTVPESTVLIRAVGARHAVMLDGGVSAQLLLRGEDATHVWRGMRNVPLALIATPRPH